MNNQPVPQAFGVAMPGAAGPYRQPHQPPHHPPHQPLQLPHPHDLLDPLDPRTVL